MSSIFTKIIKGEIPSYKIAEDENFYAFLDINPLKSGHTLVIPKKEVDYIFDLDDALYAGLFKFAKRVSSALKSAVPCARVGMTVIGLEVPHAHIHLIPIDQIGDMNFSNKKVQLSAEEMHDLAKTISNNFI